MQITFSGDDLPVVFGIQYTNLNAKDIDATVAAMDGFSSYGFALIAFTEDIQDVEAFPADKIVVPLGGTKLVDLYVSGKCPTNWKVFYDELGFHQGYYANILGDMLLNHDAKCLTLGEALNLGKFDEDVFIKPSNDLKLFGGMVIEPGNSLQDMLDQVMHKELNMEEQLILAPRKRLHSEFRCVVAFGEVIGISQYKNDRNVVEHKPVDKFTFDWISGYAREVMEVFNPADVYVVDFVEVEGVDDMKVVEYNCFNCSGLYKMDRNQVYKRIYSGIINSI